MRYPIDPVIWDTIHMAGHTSVSWAIMDHDRRGHPDGRRASGLCGRAGRRGNLARRDRHSRCIRNEHGLAKPGELVGERGIPCGGPGPVSRGQQAQMHASGDQRRSGSKGSHFR